MKFGKWMWSGVRRAPDLVAGARLPAWMARCPEWVVGGLASGSGITGAATGISEGTARAIWLGGTILIALLAIAIAAAREAANRRRSEKLSTLTQDVAQYYNNLLENQLTNLIQLVAEAIAEQEPGQRASLISGARAALIQATPNLVGRNSAANTTRANLFVTSPDGTEMRRAPGGFAGRGRRSIRVFSAGDRTFELIRVEQSRFVQSCKDELRPETAAGLEYETFLAFPVSIGRERIYGVLTVDSPRAGDLDDTEDRPLMAILAGLLAITYECEKATRLTV